VDGRLVPARDPAALAAAIVDLLADPERAAALARSGRERVKREFSVERMVEGTAAAYAGLSGRDRARRLS
jgi:starch synthase